MSRNSQTTTILDLDDPPDGTVTTAISMAMGSLFSLHCVYGGLTGVLSLWCSNVDNPSANDDDWVENTDITFAALAGAGKQMPNAANAASKYYRVKYTHTSGTGNLKIIAHYGAA